MKSKLNINTEAIKLRKKFNQDLTAPIDIFSVINEGQEVTVVFLPMNDNLSGLCIRDHHNKIIGVNSNMTLGRQRYTLAHELYHLYFHRALPTTVVCKKAIDLRQQYKEVEANIFASYFLMPYEALKFFIDERLNKEDEQLTIKDVVRIEQYFGMSRMATLWRLKNEGYLTEQQMKTMQKNIIQSALVMGYSDQLYKPGFNSKKYFSLGKYIRRAEELKEGGKISSGKYEELLLDVYRSDIVYGLDNQGEIYD